MTAIKRLLAILGSEHGGSIPEKPGIDLTDDELLLLEEGETGKHASERLSVSVIACLFLVFAGFYLVKAWSYDVGALATPGSGLFPRIIGLGLLVASAGLIWETLRISRDAFVAWPFASYALRLAIAAGASVVYVYVIPVIGQFGAGFILCVAFLFAMRQRRWWLALILSVVFSAGVQLLFGTLLGVPLPQGTLIPQAALL